MGHDIEQADTQVDAAVTAHLNARLGGQVGRAAAAFQAQLAAQHDAAARGRTRRAWILSALPAALAACIAVAATVAYRHAPAPPGEPGGTVAAQQAGAAFEQTVFYRDYDAGSLVLRASAAAPARPVRQIRRQVIERIEWFDPAQKAAFQVTVPREQTVLVNQDPF